MLRALLASRFKLTLHRERKALPVYALLPGKNGPKLRASEGEGDVSMGPAPTGIGFQRVSMTDFASRFLSRLPMIGRPVLDKTGLSGSTISRCRWSTGRMATQWPSSARQPKKDSLSLGMRLSRLVCAWKPRRQRSKCWLSTTQRSPRRINSPMTKDFVDNDEILRQYFTAWQPSRLFVQRN
jgi:hypothetical protein